MMEQLSLRIAVSMLTATLPSISMAQSCSVNPLSWLWSDNTATAVDTTSGPSTSPNTYSEWIATGAVTFIDDSDLAVGAGDVTFISDDFGSNGFNGAAFAFSGSVECVVMVNGIPVDSNDCNTTTLRADSGIIYLNDYYLGDVWAILTDLPERVIQHEIGHIFGMAHAPSGCTTFMETYLDGFEPDTLRTWEVTWINANY